MGFANNILGGMAALIRAAIKSPNYVQGSAGWSVNKDGSAEFNNVTIRGTVTSGTFQGTQFIINSSGAFYYSGTPALGNLFASDASQAGTDQFGNAYVAGRAVYGPGGSIIELTTASGPSGTIAQLLLGTGDASQAGNGSVISYVSGGGTARFLNLRILAPTFGIDLGTPGIVITSATADGTTRDEQIMLDAGSAGIVFQIDGGFGNPVTSVKAGQFQLPAGGGPFIGGEGFHAVSLAAGLTGGLPSSAGIRVKKLPWNAIWVEVQVSATATGTFTCGNLPDASYYPLTQRNFPLGVNGTNNNARLFVPTSGALQLIVGGSGAWAGGCGETYATN